MRRWLVLRLEAPLSAFGGVTVDHIDATRSFPPQSMLVGLLANALGWDRTDADAHQTLQRRLIAAARCDREGIRLTDDQTAWLESNDKGWTTHGVPEGRSGSPKTYEFPHQYRREYHADRSIRVVLRLDPSDESPTLDDLESALDHPARPLFLGRKSCPPSMPLLSEKSHERHVTAESAVDALRAVPGKRERLKAWWPQGESSSTERDGETRTVDSDDLRNWRIGLHTGRRALVEGWITPASEPRQAQSEEETADARSSRRSAHAKDGRQRPARQARRIAQSGKQLATAIHLVRAKISMPALECWAQERGWIRDGVFDTGRALHHMLGETFGPGLLGPFRLMVSPNRTTANLYGYCKLDARALREAAQLYAAPEQMRIMPTEHLASKPMPMHWHATQRLGFDLQVRPVRRTDAPLGKSIKKGAEIDTFALERRRGHQRTREDVYLDWLAGKISTAATLERETCRLARFRQRRIIRARHKGIQGPDATLHGTLTITDPIAFGELLKHGVGRHRTYGYGMLLLRPPMAPG